LATEQTQRGNEAHRAGCLTKERECAGAVCHSVIQLVIVNLVVLGAVQGTIHQATIEEASFGHATREIVSARAYVKYHNAVKHFRATCLSLTH